MGAKRRRISVLGGTAAVVLLAACGGVQLGSRETPTPRPQQPSQTRAAGAPTVDAPEFYRRMGLLAHGAPLPFTGSLAFLATDHADSTYMLLGFSMAAAALNFHTEGDQYRAEYRVQITIKRGDAIAARVDAPEIVRVQTLKETHRVDESILFQQLITLAPGAYVLDVAVRDEANGLTASQEALIRVPTLGEGTLAAPIASYEPVARLSRDSVPRLVMSPRAAATAGADSIIRMYVESYGPTNGSALSAALKVDGETVWSDSVPLTSTGPAAGLASGVVRVPVARVGLGTASLVVWRAGQPDSVRSPVFVGLGDDLPITTYADMLSYLRYFVSADRLAQLQAVPPAGRGAAWSAFQRETDSLRSTDNNGALGDYFARLRRADERFAENGTPGWRTDRGMVLLTLGDPDQVLDQAPMANDVSQKSRSELWEYRTLGLTVEFVYVAASSQWRLTASSEAQVKAAARRRVSGAAGG